MKTRNLLAAMMVVGLTWATAGCSNDVLGPDPQDPILATVPGELPEVSHPEGDLPQLPQAEKPFPAPGKVD